MRFPHFFAVVANLFFTVVPYIAEAACTQQDASTKGVHFGQLVQAKMAKGLSDNGMRA